MSGPPIFAERDPATGLVTLTRIDGDEIRSIGLNAEMSAGLSPAHSLAVVWGCVEAAPALAIHTDTILLGRR